KMISLASAEKIVQLLKDGGTIFIAEKPNVQPGIQSDADEKKWQLIVDEIWNDSPNASSWKIGKGTVIKLPYLGNDFKEIGIAPDVYFLKLNREDSETIAWTHRKSESEEIYFLSNQKEEKRTFE
ncbi:DNA-binding protein, partial [Flavobacterium circumlabens]